MSNLESFSAYSDAFEVAFESGEWEHVASFFCEDAVYEIVSNPPLAARFVGRDAVIAEFKRVLDEFDYRFDSRTPVIVEPSREIGNGVTNTFVLTYTRNGLPDVVMHGSETATYRDGKISRLENSFTDETAAMMFQWMGQNLGKLPRPVSQQNRSDEGQTLILDEDQAEAYWMPDADQGYATILLSPETSACNAFSFGTHVVPVGGKLQERCFARGDFVVYVDQGEANVVLDDTSEFITQGDTLVIARQVTHKITNAGDTELRLLWFCIPGGYERLIRECGRKKTDGNRPTFSEKTGDKAEKDYYRGVTEIGSLTPAKGQSMLVRQADRKSFWQSLPAHGYADMIISPHNYTSNSFAIGAQRLLPGAAIPPHAHARNEELLFVTDGSGYVTTESGKFPIKRGNAMFVGRFAKHGFMADDDNPLEVVWIFSPPDLETVLAAMGTLRTPGEEVPEAFIPPQDIMDILKNGGFAAM